MAIHRRFAIAISILAAMVWLALTLAILTARDSNAHDWYPIECCSAIDCAPVQEHSFVAGAIFEHGSKSMSLPRMIVTTARGTFVLPDDMPRRESKDNRMHVCSSAQGKVLCIFEPPAM